ncbi:hypothetical protein DKX38_004004 [Salix brachista]|uniref:EGF-like domain-containing protein n=1 Tax=Salix brachista TaxID=2182728 RepID=A0A5N5N8Z6_9ROSI|nr:hypothetical protein DKX38_004004 [Salix brachista]
MNTFNLISTPISFNLLLSSLLALTVNGTLQDDVCALTNCGEGACKASSASLLGFDCECYSGWKKVQIGPLTFPSCIIPNYWYSDGDANNFSDATPVAFGPSLTKYMRTENVLLDQVKNTSNLLALLSLIREENNEPPSSQFPIKMGRDELASTVDFGCGNGAPPPPPPSRPPPFDLLNPCNLVWCGDGTCVANGTGHICQCTGDSANLFNLTGLACFKKCYLGADCNGLVLGKSPPSPPPPAPTSSATPVLNGTGLFEASNSSKHLSALSLILLAATFLKWL